MAFQRDAKKGWGGGLEPLVGVVALLSCYFLLPNNFLGTVAQGLSKVPGAGHVAAGGAWAAVKLGLMPAPRTFSELLAESRLKKPGIPLRAPQAAQVAQSSIDLVRGGVSSLSAFAVSGIKGIVTPQEAAKGPSGISILKRDLAGARAEFLATASTEDVAGGPLAYAGKDFLSGEGRALGGDFLTAAMAQTDSPQAGSSRLGAARGKGSRNTTGGFMAATHEGLGQSSEPGFKSFSDLTQGQVAAAMARSPACSVRSGCPGETATVFSGAVYDGTRPGLRAPGAISAPALDGKSVPDLSGASAGDAAKNLKEAEKARKDAQACERARRQYEPEIEGLNGRIGSLAGELSAMNCGGSGFLGGLFGGSGSRACQAKRSEKAGDCRLLMNLRCAQAAACPLTAADPCESGWQCD